MATRFVNIDCDTPPLLPPDLRDWVPAGHLAHFIIDAVEALDLRQVKVNSYERAGQNIEQLEQEVQQLLAKAEQADATPLQEGLTIPESVVRAEDIQLLIHAIHALPDRCRQIVTLRKIK